MLKKIRLKGMFMKSNERKKRERKKKRKKIWNANARFPTRLLVCYSARQSTRLLETWGGKKEKKFLSIAVDNRLIEQIDFVSGSRVDRSIELSRRIINTFQTL